MDKPKHRTWRLRRKVLDNNKESESSHPHKSVTDDTGKVRLLSWDEIEPWQQHNRYIIRSYRPATSSYRQSIGSLKYVHNQTVNIYSHILGFAAFAVSSWFIYNAFAARYETARAMDLFVLGAFFLGLFTCLLLSASFHTFGNHSDSIYHSFLVLDMVGIVFLIIGSFYPGVYYGFYCEPVLAYIYWAMVSEAPLFVSGINTQSLQITVFGAGAIIVCLIPKFRHKSWRPLRTVMFVSMGLSGIMPMAHAAIKFGIPQARRHMGWAWYIGEGIFYIGGAGLYAVSLILCYLWCRCSDIL